MSTLTNPDKMWTNPSIDPGPTDTTRPNRRAAVKSLLAAIHAGAVPGLPDGLAALPAARERVEAFERDVLTSARHESPQQLVARYASALTAGKGTDPAAFITDVRTTTQATTSSDALPYTMSAIRQEVEAAVSRTLTDHAEAMLDGIRAELDTVLTEARKAGEQLRGLDVTDPTEVASANEAQRSALRSLAALAVRHNRARRLQRDVMVATGEPVGRTDHSPSTYGWGDVLPLALHEFSRANLTDHGPAPDLPPTLRLLAVVTRGDAWVPTRTELEDRWDELVNPRAKRTSREDEQVEEAQAARHKVADRRRGTTHLANA